MTDKLVEPRLQHSALDKNLEDLPSMDALDDNERRGLRFSLWAMLAAIVLLAATAWPETSPWRGQGGSLTELGAPLMGSIVSLIFVLFLIPAVVYGYAAGTVNSARDIIEGMSKAMESMAYYLVIMFFIAQFICAFSQSNLGVLLALKGAAALPSVLTIVGMILLTDLLNLFVGSASAKWALLAPIFVPMLMELGTRTTPGVAGRL